MNDLATKIRVKQLEIGAEEDPTRKKKLNYELRILSLRQEINRIKKLIEQLS
jgi:hypothetical protein